jgi:MFS family permease
MSRLAYIFGMKNLLTASLVFVAEGNIVCALAGGPILFLVGRVIVGMTAVIPILYALLRLRASTSSVSSR